MQRCILKAKIHRATVTEANLNYEGSLTLSPELMEAADFIENERVQVLNLNNGERFETYIIRGEGPGVVCLNGPAARLGHVGDKVIVLTYAWMEEEEARQHTPLVVYVDEDNRVVPVRPGGRRGLDGEVKGSGTSRQTAGVG